MKGIILERKGDWAAVLCEDGVITRTRQEGEVGETIELKTQVTAFTPKRSALRRGIAAAVVAVCILAGSFAYVTVPVSASVSVTVGESEIEIGVNRLGRVVRVDGMNEGGMELAGMLKPELRGKRFDKAFEHTMDRFEKEGMIGDDDEFVMVDVRCRDERRGEKLTEEIKLFRDGDRPRPIYFDGEVPEMPQGQPPRGGMPGQPPQGGMPGQPPQDGMPGQPPQDGMQLQPQKNIL